MKKNFSLLPLVVMLAAALMMACGGGDATTSNSAPVKKAGKKAAKKAAKKAPKNDENPWANTKVGDWVKYESKPTPAMTMEMKWTATEVTADKVTYEIATTMMGKTTKTTQTVDLHPPAGSAPKTEGPKPEMGNEDVTVNGKSIACKTISMDVAGHKSKTWTSSDVPLSGLVKSETDGKVSMELVDFGHGK